VSITSPLSRLSHRTRDFGTVFAIGLIAFALRLWHLASIKGFIFDEVYYAKDAHSLLLHGVEIDSAKNTAAFVVHPPVGKWLIAAGIKLFGFNEFGWRISAAAIGTASIILAYFTAKKLFDNYLLSISAASLILFDGLHLVHSRTALLDIFLMFFLQLTLFALLHSKHWLTTIFLGLSLATKWTGLYYIVAVLLFVLYVDYRAKRAAEIDLAARTTLLKDLPRRALQYLVLPLSIYVFTYAGWFFSDRGWSRHWADNHSSSLPFMPGVFRSWWHYQWEILDFHTSLTDTHPYSANPWSWLILGRPTSFFYSTEAPCKARDCAQEVLALGTPLLWWSLAIAFCVAIGMWIAKREWKLGLILLFVSAGYLPWFINQKRTTFYFYTIAFEPFLTLLLINLAWLWFSNAKTPEILRQRQYIWGAFLLLIALNFLYFLPLYLGTPISHSAWNARMWLPNWI